MDIIQQHGTLFLTLAVIFGLYMTWGIGANDVANVMGTSVGLGRDHGQDSDHHRRHFRIRRSGTCRRSRHRYDPQRHDRCRCRDRLA